MTPARVRGIISRVSELKGVTLDATLNSIILGTPSINLQNGLTLGAAQANRDGIKIRMKSWSAHIDVQQGSVAGANTPFRCRFILLMDMQTNAALPAVADIFANTGAGYRSRFNITTFPQRFKVLRDKLVVVNIMGGLTDQPMRACFRVKVKWPGSGQLVNYNTGNVGDVTDIQTGALYAIFCTDTSTANAATVIIDSQLRWTDG